MLPVCDLLCYYMNSTNHFQTLLTTVCALAATASAVVPVEVDGKNFVNSKTGDRFQIIGVE